MVYGIAAHLTTRFALGAGSVFSDEHDQRAPRPHQERQDDHRQAMAGDVTPGFAIELAGRKLRGA